MRLDGLIIGAVMLASAFVASNYVFPIVKEALGSFAAVAVLALIVYVPTRWTEVMLERQANRRHEAVKRD